MVATIQFVTIFFYYLIFMFLITLTAVNVFMTANVKFAKLLDLNDNLL